MDEIRTQLRLPADLHDDLRKSAQAKRQSLNKEMVERLRNSFSGSHAVPGFDEGVLSKILGHVALGSLLDAEELEALAERVAKLLRS
ncbi:Arc family DNA-binding protein [Burkholderia glumae]|uniref:Arc family DNA-binding protein n=1 Tax=Burkholderia glumae TaxID=337 RepID=UPI003B980738